MVAKDIIVFCHTALQSYKGIFEYRRLTLPYHILISKYVLQATARKNNGLRTGGQMPGILPSNLRIFLQCNLDLQPTEQTFHMTENNCQYKLEVMYNL